MNLESLNIYKSAHYKKYIVVLAIIAVILIFLAFVSPGLKMGLDLTGGSQLTVTSNIDDVGSLKTELENKFNLEDLQVYKMGDGFVIEFSNNQKIAQIEKELIDLKVLADQEKPEVVAKSKEIVSELKQAFPNMATISMQDISIPDEAYKAASQAKEEARSSLILSIKEHLNSKYNIPAEKISDSTVGAQLGLSFWNSAVYVSIIAIILVTIVIFVFFREIVPSLAVLAAAAFDILSALAAMAFFAVPVSLATIPALLMLLGYSMDTDTMLTTRILKRREGKAVDRAFDSMKTGMTMSITTLVAVSAMLVLAYNAQIIVMFQIAFVLMAGLIGDLLSTWLMNAPVLLWYAEKKEIE